MLPPLPLPLLLAPPLALAVPPKNLSNSQSRKSFASSPRGFDACEVEADFCKRFMFCSNFCLQLQSSSCCCWGTVVVVVDDVVSSNAREEFVVRFLCQLALRFYII